MSILAKTDHPMISGDALVSTSGCLRSLLTSNHLTMVLVLRICSGDYQVQKCFGLVAYKSAVEPVQIYCDIQISAVLSSICQLFFIQNGFTCASHQERHKVSSRGLSKVVEAGEFDNRQPPHPCVLVQKIPLH